VPGWLFQSWDCLELDDDAVLCDENQSYNMTVYVSNSNVTFDCNHQIIDHNWVEGNAKYAGVRLPQTYSVSNISMRNCTVRNVGSYGINLKRFFRGAQLEGPMVGHQNIEIKDFDITNPDQTGIYVGQNSKNVTIDGVYIDHAHIGIYLEAGSMYSHIVNSMISNSTDREAIAVDSSIYNTIEFCTFENNNGGIHLYKNCGETRGQVCPIRRKYSASHNVIRGNIFRGDDVEVAWRQFKLYAAGHCIGIDILGFWRDRSDNNMIYDNTFYNGADLHVKDGPNAVYRNRFIDSDLVIGKDNPPGDDPVILTGDIGENLFNESDVDFDTSRNDYAPLNFFNNVDEQNICIDADGMNDCGPPTILWGEKILSAGVVTIVFSL
jgi:parallel beta-helix repeat protein